MKEKAIRKVKYLYHMVWCRLYSDIIGVPCLIHHWDEYEEHMTNGLTVKVALAVMFRKYYPKWAEHADKMIQYK